MEKENIIIIMEVIILVILLMIKKKGLELFFGIKIFIMKVTGKMISKMEKEDIIIKVI